MPYRGWDGNVAAIAVEVSVLVSDTGGIGTCDDLIDAVRHKVITLADNVGESIPYISILIVAQRCRGDFQCRVAVGLTGETTAVDTYRRRCGPAGNICQ